MTDSRDRDQHERARELSQWWQSAVVPVEDEAATETRKARIVPALGATIARSAARRGHERTLRRISAALALAAGVAMTVGVGSVAVNHFRPSATASATAAVGAVSGNVTLVHDSVKSTVEHATLAIGDRFATAPNDTAEVRLTEIVHAHVAGASEVVVVTPRGSVHRLRLERGEIEAKVDDHPSPTPKLIVETPNVDVVVTGTIFRVDVTPMTMGADAVTRVSVTKGRIVVRRGNTEVAAVTAGQTWTSDQSAATSATNTAAQASPVTEGLPRDVSAERGAPEMRSALAEQNRLFQSAVDARNQGDNRTAIAQLTTLFTRYPASPLAREARDEARRLATTPAVPAQTPPSQNFPDNY